MAYGEYDTKMIYHLSMAFDKTFLSMCYNALKDKLNMKDTIANMELAELGIAILALLIGLVVGYLVHTIRQFLKDQNFKSEEKQIAKQIQRMSLDEIRELSAAGRIHIDPAIKTLLGKIDRELNSIEIHHRERSEIEDDLDTLSGVLQQLANA